MGNIWEKIPLDDYEKHMSHPTVGQQQLLNVLTAKYLSRFRPGSLMCLGVSGGNGLEHVDSTLTRDVYAVDINPDYLRETDKRFGQRIDGLHLVQLDLAVAAAEIVKVDLCWAALIFEYLDVRQGFRFLQNNVIDEGHAAVTIQVNNGVTSVSQTGVETIKQVGQIFRIVDPTELLNAAAYHSFALVDEEENFLPNGKSFKTFCFQKG
ncbi:MAG TPA: class I SAM-dependent methyltransferase [Chryseosolibacter sp.]